MVGCDDATFSGSKTNNDNQYLVDFDILNTTLYGSMPLFEGDIIKISVKIKKGKVGIIVNNENGTVAYEENDAETCILMIEVKQSGTYKIHINGYKAKGSVYIEKCEV